MNDLVPLPELPSHPHRNNILYMPGFNVDEELISVPRVKPKQIERLRELGSGAFGTVWEGYVSEMWSQHSPKVKVAIKVSNAHTIYHRQRKII